MAARKLCLGGSPPLCVELRDFTVRSALADKARIFDLMLQFPRGIPPADWTEREIELDLPGKWELSFGLYVEGRLEGMLFGSVLEARCHVHLFVVDRALRGRGAGGLMIREAMRRASAGGLAGLRLKINERNESGLSFYLGNNFKVVQRGLGGTGEYVLLHCDLDQVEEC